MPIIGQLRQYLDFLLYVRQQMCKTVLARRIRYYVDFHLLPMRALGFLEPVFLSMFHILYICLFMGLPSF